MAAISSVSPRAPFAGYTASVLLDFSVQRRLAVAGLAWKNARDTPESGRRLMVL